MAGDRVDRLAHGGVRRALQPEKLAVPDGGDALFVEPLQGLVAGGFGFLHVGGTVDKTAEALMVRPVAVILHQVGRILDEKDDPVRVGEPSGFLGCQVAVAQNDPIL